MGTQKDIVNQRDYSQIPNALFRWDVPYAKFKVAAYMIGHLDADDITWASVATIAFDCNLSDRMVEMVRAELLESGMFVKLEGDDRYPRRGAKSAQYKFVAKKAMEILGMDAVGGLVSELEERGLTHTVRKDEAGVLKIKFWPADDLAERIGEYHEELEKAIKERLERKAKAKQG